MIKQTTEFACGPIGVQQFRQYLLPERAQSKNALISSNNGSVYGTNRDAIIPIRFIACGGEVLCGFGVIGS